MKKLILIIASVVIVSSTHLILSSASEQTRKRPHSTISSTGSSTTSPQNAHVQAFFTPQDDVEAKLRKLSMRGQMRWKESSVSENNNAIMRMSFHGNSLAFLP